MVWRIVGGLGGWLGSLAPLVIVNLLAFTTAIDPGLLSIAGGVALAVGVALGGLLAGLLGGKRGAGWGGVMAGAIAAVLFAATLAALMYALRAQNDLPYLLALHPLRALGAIAFLACLVAGMAALVGAISGRRREARWQAQLARASARTTPRGPSQPYPHPGPPQPPYSGRGSYPSRSSGAPPGPQPGSQRPAPSTTRSRSESHARERSPRW
jgi:hypothetical protein